MRVQGYGVEDGDARRIQAWRTSRSTRLSTASSTMSPTAGGTRCTRSMWWSRRSSYL